MRHLGTAGNEKRISQIKATATNFKRLIGLPWEHHVVQSMASGTFAAPYKLIKCNETGGAAVQLPDGNVYAIQQVMAMFLGKMKEIAEGWFQVFYFEIYGPNLFTNNARIFLEIYFRGLLAEDYPGRLVPNFIRRRIQPQSRLLLKENKNIFYEKFECCLSNDSDCAFGL